MQLQYTWNALICRFCYFRRLELFNFPSAAQGILALWECCAYLARLSNCHSVNLQLPKAWLRIIYHQNYQWVSVFWLGYDKRITTKYMLWIDLDGRRNIINEKHFEMLALYFKILLPQHWQSCKIQGQLQKKLVLASSAFNFLSLAENVNNNWQREWQGDTPCIEMNQI